MVDEVQGADTTTEAGTEQATEVLVGAADETKNDVLLAGAGDDAEGTETDGKADDADKGVPEAYTFEVPEDLKADVTEETVAAMLDEFGPKAKEIGLSQQQFQALVEYDARRAKETTESGALSYHTRVQEWAEQVKNDPRFGGPELQANLELAELGLNKLGTPGLRSLLLPPSEKNPEGLGLGNHPEILRLLRNIGKQYANSETRNGRSPAEEQAAIEADEARRLARIYPSMVKQT